MSYDTASKNTSFSPLNHPKTIDNGHVEPGAREPLPESATSLRRMSKPGITRDTETGGRPAGELGSYQMRRGKRSCRRYGGSGAFPAA
jgi:hypothetical protein